MAGICTVDGCTGPRHGSGLCAKHYKRFRKHGSGYRAVHNRLSQAFGPARAHACTICREQADQWAYDHQDPEERVGIVHDGIEVPFSVKPEHYVPLCHPCHRRLDLRWIPVMVA